MSYIKKMHEKSPVQAVDVMGSAVNLSEKQKYIK